MNLSPSERLRKLREKKNEEDKSTGSSSKTLSAGDRLREIMSPKVEARERAYAGNKFGIDTLESDLKSVTSSINTAYSKWQDADTLKKTKTSVEEMKSRLEKYKSYQEQYGGADLSDFSSSLDKVLGDWDKLSSTYGQYKTADAFDNDMKRMKFDAQFSYTAPNGDRVGLTFDEVQAEKKKYDKDSDEYKYLDSYTGYTDLKEFDKAIAFAKGGYVNSEGKLANTEDKFKIFPPSSDVDKATKNIGKGITLPELDIFPSLEKDKIPLPKDAPKIKNTTDAIKNLDDTAYKKQLDELERAKNVHALDNLYDNYKHYESEEGYKETSKYDSSVDNEIYKYINDEKYRNEMILNNTNMSTATIDIDWYDKAYDYMQDNEKATYNHIFKKYGEEEANKFLDGIEKSLRRRKTQYMSDFAKDEIDKGTPLAWFMNLTSPVANLMGGVASAVGTLGAIAKGEELDPYANYNSVVNFNSAVREHTGNKIAENTDWEIGGVNVPSFLYQTGMSIGDTVVGGATLGSWYSVVAGSNAFQQKAKELKEAGENESVIIGNAFASGLAEMAFEYISLDKLIKINNVDSFKKYLIASWKQAGIEGSEELATEVANIAFDEWFRGDNSQLSQMKKDLMRQGYTEEEAYKETRNQMIRQVGEALAGGILSGKVMGSVASAGNYAQNKGTGAEIRANDRVGDMWDMSAMTPQESETFKLYTEYFNKGVNEGNISDAKLGNLYNTATEEAQEGLYSKKSSTTDRMNAVTSMNKLEKISTPNTEAKAEAKRQERVKELSVGEVTEVTATGNSVDLKGIKINNDEITLVTNEGEFSAKDLTFSKERAELVSYAEVMGEEKGSALLAHYDGSVDVDTYVKQFEKVYYLGELQAGVSTALEGAGKMSASKVSDIYRAGRKSVVTARQDEVNQLTNNYVAKKFYKGSVNDSAIDHTNSGKGEVNWNDLRDFQRENVVVMNAIYKGLGINLRWTTKGIEKGYNGYYSPENNEVVLDVYAGVDKKGSIKDINLAIVSTSSHELTHWMEAKSPEIFEKLKNHVFETLRMNDGLSDLERIEAEKKRIREVAKKNGRKIGEITDEYAISEIVARSCEDMLSMSEMGKEAFSKLSKAERDTLYKKIKGIFEDMLEYINSVLAKYKSKTRESEIISEYKDRLEEQLKLWGEAMKNAVFVNQAMKKEGINDNELVNDAVETVGLQFDAESKSIAPTTQFSERTWSESEYVQDKEVAVNAIVKAIGVTKADAERYINNINSIAKMIADDRVRLDYAPNMDEFATVLKSNSEYKWTLDMSTLCAKRLLFTGTFDAIQKALPNTALDSDDIVGLRSLMMSRGYEVACGICYVESTRREIGTITADFIERYKESQKTGKPITRVNSQGKVVELKKTKEQMETTADKSSDRFVADKNYTPTLAELNTTDIDIVKKDHPLVYEAYLNYMNARGQAKPKLLETRAEYKGEILKHFKSKSAVKSRNDAGGLRLQSFSDFEVAHLIDMMQVTLDMSRVGLMSQAYTKVPAFAEVFGDTGIKINLSLIAKDSGLDADGNLIFDDVEGINHEEAFRLRDKYSKNVGTILVGKNDAHIIKAMADPRIDYIIPFHKSSWKESLYDALGLTGYDDYTDTQNEKYIDKSRGTAKNIQPSEYWDYNLSGDENAKVYLEMCKNDGRIPKFPQFQGYEGYWKLLIDFKMYDNDGVGSPQTVVKPNFSMDEAKQILNAYEGGHQTLPVAKDVVDDFVAEYKKNHSKEQYSDRDSAIKKGMTDEERYSILKDKSISSIAKVDEVKMKEAEEKYDIYNMHTLKESARKKLLKKVGDEFEVFKDYDNKDVEISFTFSKSGMEESEAKQRGNYDVFAKMFSCFDEVIESAIGIEVHNRNAEGYKPDPTLESVYVLVSAFENGENIVPVKLEIKEFNDKKNTLHVAIALESIEKDKVLRKGDTIKGVTQVPRLSEISLADLFKNINPSDETFLKYVPKQFLENDDIRFSDRDYGYHAGDLGKAESYGEQGSYRGTGHFGTGTYFVGNPEKIKDYNKRNGQDAPVETVDFSKYNLFTVRNVKDGRKLHDALRVIDGGINESWIDKLANMDFHLMSVVEENRIEEEMFPNSRERYATKNRIKILHTLADKYGIKLTSYEDFKKDYKPWVYDADNITQEEYEIRAEEDTQNVYYEHIQEEYDKARGDIEGKYKKLFDAYNDLRYVLGYRRDVLDALRKVVEHDKAVQKGSEYTTDSRATVFMKALGYEGIDVRGVEELDNTEYGSVIYDLKGEDLARKQEIGTAKFSDRETESAYDLVGEADRLASENKQIQDDVDRLKERNEIMKEILGDFSFKPSQLKASAKHLLNISQSTYSEDALVKNLNSLYSYILSTPKLEWDSLTAKCYEVADYILSEQNSKKVEVGYFRQALNDIRNGAISLSEEQIAEAKNMYGDKYRNALLGRVVISNNGTSLDQKWSELSQKYPELFKMDVPSEQRVTELSDIYDSLKESASVYEKFYDMDNTRQLAVEIYNQFWNVTAIKDVSDKYKKRIQKLNFDHRQMMSNMRKDYEQRLADQKKADRAKYSKLANNLRDREKTRVQEAKEFGRRRLHDYKDRAEKNAKIKSITDKALVLNKWLTKNSKDEHIAEPLKKPVAYLLDAIDFSSKQLLGMRGGQYAGVETKKDISLSKALEQVHDMARGIENSQIGEDDISSIYGTFADFPAGFADDVRDLSGKVNDIMRSVGDNEYVLNQMTLEELETLDKIITTMKSTVTKMNKFLAVRHAQGVANLSQESINYLDSLGKGKVEGKLKKLLNWGNALPYYAFKRFGEGGQKVYEALMDGWDKFAFHTKTIIDYAEKTYTAKEIKEWERDIKTIEVLEPVTDAEMDSDDYEPTYQTIQMTVPQIMSLYCLQKREQAKSHLIGGGIRIADIETKKGPKKNVISQSEGVTLSSSEIDKIIGNLTARQIEVADKLQEFMNTTCTDWGNEVSMLRFGYKAFGEENYFPIQSDKNNLAVNDETENQNSLFRLLNMSFTKGTIKKANNRVVISDIFDVFAQHTSDMAKYNALALPILDSFKWYNYKEKSKQGETQHKTKSLKQSLENAFGTNAQSYITTFLRDINGADNSSRDTIGKHFFTSAKIASVGANLRVILLQPTAYYRAFSVIDAKYLVKAFGHTLKYDKVDGKKVLRAERYCGIALWKALGFYDTNIQKGVTDLIKQDQSLKDKAVEVSMWGAEMADKFTWGVLWNACELEVRAKQKDLEVGSDEFNNAIAKRLREVIYATQVVDSTMTRSQMMRSKDGRDQILTAFASEPTLSYNMMQDAIFEIKLAKRRGENKESMRKHRHRFVRVAVAYTVTNMMCALVEAGFDAYRDEEDEEKDLAEFMKAYLKNFASDMSFVAKLPYIKDAISIFQGYSSTRLDTQWMSSFYYAGTGFIKNIHGNGNAYTTFKNIMKSLSYVSGLPFYNAWRDSMSLLDKTEILTVEELEEAFNEVYGIE